MSNLVGTQFDRYRIEELVGEGGMAVVYRAINLRLDAEVAVKVIRTERLSPDISQKALKRFEREAKSLAQLTHPNIVGVMDYGEYDGQPYLVMQYLRGGSMRKFMGRPMPWPDAARLLIPVAQALDYAHQHNIIHRDVKPSNILLTESGQPMLADFGIAKIIEEDMTVDLTGTRGTIGTPEYMSPEQGLGKAVDGRTDIYALGVVFYEAITGRKPFIGDTPMETLFMHVNAPLPRPTTFIPHLPASIENVLLRSLAKKVDDRYADMGSFARALEEIGQGMSGRKRQESVSPKPAPIPIRRKEKGPVQSDTTNPQSPARELVEGARAKPWGTFTEKLRAWFSGAIRTTTSWGAKLTNLVPRRSAEGSLRPRKWLPVFGALAVPILLVAGFLLFSGQIITHRTGIYLTSDSTGKSQIYYFLDGELTPITSASRPGENWMPAPDGFGNLYFVSNRDGRPNIYVMNRREGVKQVTGLDSPTKSWSPAPDGRGNLYFVSDRSGSRQIYVLNKDGANPVTPLDGKGENWSPAPDGLGNLYFVSDRDGRVNIYVLNQREGVKQVTGLNSTTESWSPAPDGSGNLYFVSDRDGRTNIYVMNAREGVKQVTGLNNPTESWAPVPDGWGNLYFTSDRDGEIQVFRFGKKDGTQPVTDAAYSSWLGDPDEK